MVFYGNQRPSDVRRSPACPHPGNRYPRPYDRSRSREPPLGGRGGAPPSRDGHGSRGSSAILPPPDRSIAGASGSAGAAPVRPPGEIVDENRKLTDRRCFVCGAAGHMVRSCPMLASIRKTGALPRADAHIARSAISNALSLTRSANGVNPQMNSEEYHAMLVEIGEDAPDDETMDEHQDFGVAGR